jgi:SAM-dependent methyltransferase
MSRQELILEALNDFNWLPVISLEYETEITMVKKPTHMGQDANISNSDLAGYFPDNETIESVYRSQKSKAYHADRSRCLKVLVDEITSYTKESELSILDYGIGDGLELSTLNLRIKELIGIDTSPPIIEMANGNISVERKTLIVGGVETLASISSDSIDLALAINVLGYLSQEEEREFWIQTKRILKNDGFILILVGNRLFDLFALNSGTAEFFREELGVFNAGILLRHADADRFKNARRHNPLELENSLSEYGLSLIKTSFSQWHEIPPMILEIEEGLDLGTARLKARDNHMDPNSLNADQKWRAYFQCSLVGLLFRST